MDTAAYSGHRICTRTRLLSPAVPLGRQEPGRVLQPRPQRAQLPHRDREQACADLRRGPRPTVPESHTHGGDGSRIPRLARRAAGRFAPRNRVRRGTKELHASRRQRPAIRRTTPPDYHDRNLEFGFRRGLVRSSDQVLMVDDWIATGSQPWTVRAMVDTIGATWVGVGCIVDALDDSRARRDLGQRSLLHLRDLWLPSRQRTRRRVRPSRPVSAQPTRPGNDAP